MVCADWIVLHALVGIILAPTTAHAFSLRTRNAVANASDTNLDPLKKENQRLPDLPEARVSRETLLCGLKHAVRGRWSKLATDNRHQLPKYSSCAVVGSSGMLLRHEHGQAINNAKMVMRFNDAPVTPYEKFVGNRTTIRITNEKALGVFVGMIEPDDQACKDCDGIDSDRLVQESPALVTTCAVCNTGNAHTVTIDEFNQRRHKFRELYPSVDAYDLDLAPLPDLEMFFQKFFNVGASAAGPTTGAVGLVLALSICDEVTAYGIALSREDDYDSPYHYYSSGNVQRQVTLGSQIENNTTWHASFLPEKLLWKKLATNSVKDIDEGVAVIPGFESVDCSNFLGNVDMKLN